MSKPILILGIGNTLLSDDGLGPYIIEELQNYSLKGVKLIDGGTQGLNLMPYFEDIDRVILIDAISSSNYPLGEVLKIPKDNILKTLSQKMSVHEIGIVDLLSNLSLVDKEPKEIILIGLVTNNFEFAYGVSPIVKENKQKLIEAIISTLNLWQEES